VDYTSATSDSVFRALCTNSLTCLLAYLLTYLLTYEILENVAIANALQLEASGATPTLSRINYNAV